MQAGRLRPDTETSPTDACNMSSQPWPASDKANTSTCAALTLEKLRAFEALGHTPRNLAGLNCSDCTMLVKGTRCQCAIEAALRIP